MSCPSWIQHTRPARPTRGDLVGDRVEGKLAYRDLLAEREPQHEVGRRHPPRDDDLGLCEFGEPARLAGDHDRPVADAERGAVESST